MEIKDHGEKIRVLITDSHPEFLQNLQRLLAFEEAIYVVASTTNGQEAFDS